MPSIISMLIISIIVFAKIRSVKSLIYFTGFGLLIIVGFGAVSDGTLPSVSHLLAKASSLKEFGANSGSASIDLRWQYYREGVTLIFDNPSILLVGTVGQGNTPLTQEPIFTGDGFLVGAMVTYGLPFFIIFFGSLSLIILKECSARDSSRKIVGKVLLIYFISFLTNRILDYWPMALLFFVFFAIGVDSVGKSLGRLQSEHSQPSAAVRGAPMS